MRLRGLLHWGLLHWAVAALTVAGGLDVGGAVALAAQDPADRVRDEVDVVEVLLDVLVTDSDGNVIVGLEKDDFRVEEDGAEIAIESVSFYSNRELWSGFGEVASVESDADVEERRFFVLFFYRPPVVELRDLSFYAKISKAGRQALDWVAVDVMPDDYVAVVTYDGALNIVQNFTPDPELIDQSIWRSATGKAPKRRWKSRTSEPIPGISLAPLMHDPEIRDRTGDLFSAVTELAGGLGGVPGRKILVMLGADFPSESSLDSRRHYARMVEALNTHNVAVYPVDATADGQKPTLIRLAADTGGRYAARGNDVHASLADISRENSGFYLLSYRSNKPADEDGYQEISVRMNNPELRARTRSGYAYGRALEP